MAWGYYYLSTLISSFDELPEIYKQAEAMGTNFFFLSDYWEGDVSGFPTHYWNKGTYLPRADLGGEKALIRGIKSIHDKGGKVIIYVEPFIIYIYSKVGMKNGKKWAAYLEDGKSLESYEKNYSMLAPCTERQDYVAEISKKLVNRYDVDGIFLDSYGYQFSLKVYDFQQKLYSPMEWNRGVYELTDKVRTAVTEIKPDVVILWNLQEADSNFMQMAA